MNKLKEQIIEQIEKQLNKKPKEVSLKPIFDSLMKNKLSQEVIRELSKR